MHSTKTNQRRSTLISSPPPGSLQKIYGSEDKHIASKKVSTQSTFSKKQQAEKNQKTLQNILLMPSKLDYAGAKTFVEKKRAASRSKTRNAGARPMRTDTLATLTKKRSSLSQVRLSNVYKKDAWLGENQGTQAEPSKKRLQAAEPTTGSENLSNPSKDEEGSPQGSKLLENPFYLTGQNTPEKDPAAGDQQAKNLTRKEPCGESPNVLNGIIQDQIITDAKASRQAQQEKKAKNLKETKEEPEIEDLESKMSVKKLHQPDKTLEIQKQAKSSPLEKTVVNKLLKKGKRTSEVTKPLGKFIHIEEEDIGVRQDSSISRGPSSIPTTQQLSISKTNTPESELDQKQARKPTKKLHPAPNTSNSPDVRKSTGMEDIKRAETFFPDRLNSSSAKSKNISGSKFGKAASQDEVLNIFSANMGLMQGIYGGKAEQDLTLIKSESAYSSDPNHPSSDSSSLYCGKGGKPPKIKPTEVYNGESQPTDQGEDDEEGIIGFEMLSPIGKGKPKTHSAVWSPSMKPPGHPGWHKLSASPTKKRKNFGQNRSRSISQSGHVQFLSKNNDASKTEQTRSSLIASSKDEGDFLLNGLSPLPLMKGRAASCYRGRLDSMNLDQNLSAAAAQGKRTVFTRMDPKRRHTSAMGSFFKSRNGSIAAARRASNTSKYGQDLSEFQEEFKKEKEREDRKRKLQEERFKSYGIQAPESHLKTVKNASLLTDRGPPDLSEYQNLGGLTQIKEEEVEDNKVVRKQLGQQPGKIFDKQTLKKQPRKDQKQYQKQIILYGIDVLSEVQTEFFGKNKAQQRRDSIIDHSECGSTISSCEDEVDKLKNELSVQKQNTLISSGSQDPNAQVLQRNNFQCLDRFVISKEKRWKGIFDLIMMLASCYNIFGNAYSAAFGEPEGFILFIDLVVVEQLFLLDMIFCFFQAFVDEETFKLVTNFQQIAKHYLKKNFIFDFVAWAPIGFLANLVGSPIGEKERLLRMFKLFRIPRLAQLIDKAMFKQIVESFLHSQYGFRSQGGHDDEQHLQTRKVLYCVHLYSILQIIIIIFSTSYFLAILWYVFVKDVINWEFPTSYDVYNGYITFYNYDSYDFIDGSTPTDDNKSLVQLVYYAITTLSTIGFGDFSPKSLEEKAVCVFILLLGVTLFSIIMSKFIVILTEFKEMDKQGNPKELSRWIKMLSKFNQGMPLSKEIISQIEDFFDYYWVKNRSAAMQSKNDKRFLSELPQVIVERIYLDHLYGDFQYIFRRYFHKKTFDNKVKINTETNLRERRAMVNLMSLLEPRQYKVGSQSVIQKQHSEVFEVLFIMKGRVGVKYRLFNEVFTAMTLKKSHVINDYALIKSKVSEFEYQPVLEHVEGFALRREHFNQILKNKTWRKFAIIWERIYISEIQDIVRAHREEKAEHFQNREDYCNMRAFGVGYDDDEDEEGLGRKQVDEEEQEFLDGYKGVGRLAYGLKKIENALSIANWELMEMALQYDLAMSKIINSSLISGEKELKN